MIAGWPPEPSRATGGWPRLFLASRCSPADDELRLGRLTAADVSAFMLEQSACRSAGSLGNVITGLRALLRFLYLRGYTPLPLAAAVPAVAAHRAEASRTLSAGEVTRLLASCDRRTAIGRRDYAILTVLVRLGLRAGEVAALTLEDIDWRAGELVVRGKGAPRATGCRCRSTSARRWPAYLRRGPPARRVPQRVRARPGAVLRADAAARSARSCVRAASAPACPSSRAHRLRHARRDRDAARGRRRWSRSARSCATATPPRRRSTPRSTASALVELARPWPERRCDERAAPSRRRTTWRSGARWASSSRGYDRLLADLVAYLEARRATTLTTELAVAWATRPAGAQPFGGRRGCRSRAASRATCRRSTRRAGAAEPPAGHRRARPAPTSTATPRSPRCWTRPTRSRRRCARRPTAR